MDQVERLWRERHRRGAARHPQPVGDVGFHFLSGERLQRAADRNALIQLPQFGLVQQFQQVELPDDHDLQQLLVVGLEVRENADFLEHVSRQVLRLVDDQHGAAVQRHQREQEVVEGANQFVLARGREAARLERVLRDHAETEQHLAEQLFNRQEWVENQRREGGLVKLFEQRAAQRGFARADVAGQDDEALFATNRLPHLLQGDVVGFAAVQKPRIRRQAERRLNEPVVVLVHAAWSGKSSEDEREGACLPETA